MSKEVMTDDKAYALIGANIRAYGHFESYMIPYSNGRPIETEKDVTLSEFLEFVFNFYNSKDLMNLSYGCDLADENKTKSFIKGIAKRSHSYYEECVRLGKEWCNEQSWKN